MARPERFYQAQATIPGKVNVSGASLFGVPLVLIGHTQTMAWSHTVSTAFRFTPYQLTLVPGSPTTYLRDGKPVADDEPRGDRPGAPAATASSKPRAARSTSRPVSGRCSPSLVGIPLPWTPATAFAMRDANADNFRVFNHFFATDRAKSAQQELGDPEDATRASRG